MVEGMKKPSAGRGLETCVGVICTALADPASPLLAYSALRMRILPHPCWRTQHCACGSCLTLVGVSALRMRILPHPCWRISTAHADPASPWLAFSTAYADPASPWLAFQHCVCGSCLTLVGVSALRMQILPNLGWRFSTAHADPASDRCCPRIFVKTLYKKVKIRGQRRTLRFFSSIPPSPLKVLDSDRS